MTGKLTGTFTVSTNNGLNAIVSVGITNVETDTSSLGENSQISTNSNSINAKGLMDGVNRPESVKPDTALEQSKPGRVGRSPGYVFGTLITAILCQCSPNSVNEPGDDSIQSVGSPLELLAGGVQGARAVVAKGSSSLLDDIRNAGGTLAIQRGQVSAEQLAALTRSSGNEFAIFRNRGTGELFVRELGKVNGEIPLNSRLIIHSQPGIRELSAIPSAADRLAIQIFGQRSSVIINETGEFSMRFGTTNATDNPIRTIPRFIEE